jgi:DNA-binding CsgD family transcriptional regulator
MRKKKRRDFLLIEKGDLILWNEIIHRIYCMENFDEMRHTVLHLIQPIIPYKLASFYLASNQPEHLLCKPVGINITDAQLQSYLDDLEEIDYTRWIFMSGKSMAYRETDLLSDSKREGDAYYKQLYEPSGMHFSLQLSIAYQDTFLGIISFYRTREDGDFTDDELFLLDSLKEHLAFRLHQQAVSAQIGTLVLKGKTHYDTADYITKYHLTIREIEVLGLLLGGLSNDKICEVLVVSPHTLKKHALNIYKKLGVKNRWELFNMDI